MASNSEHKNEQTLLGELAIAQAKISVGGLYGHYKSPDKTYKVTGLGFIEATGELAVIYQAQYGEHPTFIRPLDVWLESVEWNSELIPRFRKLR